MPVRNLRDATVVIADDGGSAGADKITLTLEEGNLQWTESNPVDIISDRGTLDHARQGNDVPLQGSFSVLFQSFLDPNSANITPYEALTQSGGASAWGSDASNGGDAYAVIMEVTIADPNGGSSEVITITELYPEEIEFTEGSPSNRLSFSFRALMTRPTYA